jgi:hypothetical protein
MQKWNPKNEEILGNSFKQSTNQGGKSRGKRRNKEKGPKFEPKEQNKNGSQKGTKINHVPKLATIARSILERKKMENLKEQ